MERYGYPPSVREIGERFDGYLGYAAAPSGEVRRAVDAIAGLTAVDGAAVISDQYDLLAFGAKIGRREGSTPVGKVMVGTPVANRSRPELEELIGSALHQWVGPEDTKACKAILRHRAGTGRREAERGAGGIAGESAQPRTAEVAIRAAYLSALAHASLRSFLVPSGLAPLWRSDSPASTPLSRKSVQFPEDSKGRKSAANYRFLGSVASARNACPKLSTGMIRKVPA